MHAAAADQTLANDTLTPLVEAEHPLPASLLRSPPFHPLRPATASSKPVEKGHAAFTSSPAVAAAAALIAVVLVRMALRAVERRWRLGSDGEGAVPGGSGPRGNLWARAARGVAAAGCGAARGGKS